MSEKGIDVARQLSKDKSVSGSQSVADIAKKLNAGVGKPLDISRTQKPLEGSNRKGKK